MTLFGTENDCIRLDVDDARTTTEMPPDLETRREHTESQREAHQRAVDELSRHLGPQAQQQRAETPQQLTTDENRHWRGLSWRGYRQLRVRLHERALKNELIKSRAILRNHFGPPPQ